MPVQGACGEGFHASTPAKTGVSSFQPTIFIFVTDGGSSTMVTDQPLYRWNVIKPLWFYTTRYCCVYLGQWRWSSGWTFIFSQGQV